MENKSNVKSIGKIISIDGPIIGINGLETQKIGDLIKIGEKKLIGEIIKISKNKTTAQCYDFTDGLGLEEVIYNTNQPLYMELAPGLLGNIFDGIQRPLNELFKKTGAFIDNVQNLDPLSREKKWVFKPIKKINEFVEPGDILGTIKENNYFTHKIMVPPEISGKLIKIANEGKFSIDAIIYTIKNGDDEYHGNMIQKWAIRKARPYKSRQYPLIIFS